MCKWHSAGSEVQLLCKLCRHGDHVCFNIELLYRRIKTNRTNRNALKSNRLVSFSFDGSNGIIKASVQPSMKKGVYNVMVNHVDVYSYRALVWSLDASDGHITQTN